MITLSGKKASGGIAIGKILFYKRDLKDIRRIYVRDIDKEIQRFTRARERAQQELEGLYESSAREVGEVNAAIFEMQQQILQDQDFIDQITRIIVEEKLNAEYAIQQGAEQFIKYAKKEDISYVTGHAVDVRDVAFRLIRTLSRNWKDRLMGDEPFIMAASELYPSEVVQLDTSKVKGIVTMHGSVNSHTAVLARTKGIPAVLGIGEVLKEEYDGKTIIVDGNEGRVYIEPDYAMIQKMQQQQKENRTEERNLERLKGKENVTQSGQRIDITANIGSREDIDTVMRSDAGGIGLLRSEFLYLNNTKLPTEEQQYQTYLLAAESMGSKPVVIRTADLGGDRNLSVLKTGQEKNPTMGLRGIRVSLEKEDMFRTQLRAILRASANGNVSILFPMIDCVEEVQRAKILLERAKKELKDEKTAFDEHIQVGAMVETPAAVMISGELAREVDFLSLGTNDLTQFTLGMDRDNKNLAPFYNKYHPAVMKMLRIVANNVHLEGKRISVTGDLAADTSLTEYFLEIGIDELSVAPDQVLNLRKRIREV